MKLYGMKMFNFMRFGESDNSIVFNVTEEQRSQIQDGHLTFDQLYQSLSDNPLEYIETVNATEDNVLEGIIGISGMTAGSFDSSNGSGKSTIFEAMAFLFYDRVVRQTANTDKKAIAGLSVVTKLAGEYPKTLRESYVEAYFEENEKIYRVKRGRTFTKTHKNSTPVFEFDCIKDDEVDSLSGHRKKDTKRSLEDVIVEDYDIFVNTVMFGQSDAGKFLTGTDKIKKDMIIELLKLEDIVKGCIDVIRAKKKEENDKLSDSVSRSSSFQDLVAKDYKKLSPEWEKDGEEYSSGMIDCITGIINDILKDNKDAKDKALGDIKALEEEIKKLEESDVLKKIKELKEEGSALVKKRKEAEQKKDQELKDWKAVLKQCESDESSVKDKLSACKSKFDSLVLKLKGYQDTASGFNEEEWKEKIAKCEKADGLTEKYQEMSDELEKKREETLKTVSEFDAVITYRTKDLESLQEQVEKTGDGDHFVCKECQSVVTKEHTLKKIEDITEVVKTNTETRDKVQEKLDKLNEARKSVREKLQKIREYKVQHQKLLAEKQSADNASDNIKQTKDQINKNEEDITENNKKKEELLKKIEEYKKKCLNIESNFQENIKDIDQKIKDKKAEIIELNRKASGIEEDILELNAQKKVHVNAIATIDKECGSLQEKQDQVIDLGKQIADEEKKAEEIKMQLHRLKILESAFGLEGVQTRIVSKYLPLLNMYVKQFLDVLSNGKLIVNLIINDKSKIDMEIIGGTADNYIMLSGGEKMVVRLAVDVGLSLLSFSRTSRTPDMICLDEIFGPLDPEHTKSVFRMLDALKDRFKRVFLISHKSEIQSLVKNNIIVEKASGNVGLSKITRICDVSV